ncbi:sulfur oxidation c-type cytochrome SoxX [Nitrogeniibacter mangrovi]|uniref:Sulfur oxidation c-type cytochrome SoxX n=1 Tax=Nitrogeniibacter mangrovi TaxID=2016596 RepID=A0A6C1B584_9RHOO|nr:sulfur oxidation c-type cytochrome SoxX [Nitrogeniibacter mangrovi]QID18627.1 sulfur oxidation c-type cytochrome SoxX [Nitrogeniibacter mangrovi]
MKLKLMMIAPLALAANLALADDTYVEFKQMMDQSFRSKGIADKHRLYQLDFQKECSGKTPDKARMAQIEAAQLASVKYPADGQYLGDWKKGEKIAISGRGLTWRDKADAVNGGGCYNCHQLSHHEIAFGTIGPSLLEYGKVRGASEDMVRYTWAKIWNAKAFNACSNMPRNGDSGLLTEAQIKDVMAYLFDPESPVNKP